MKDKLFYILVTIIVVIGIATTLGLAIYTINLSKTASITSFISNER